MPEPVIIYHTSEEYTRQQMARFFLKTSIPRLIKKHREEQQNNDEAI
jgi:hypothetical protein